jgi:hypothetical protein
LLIAPAIDRFTQFFQIVLHCLDGFERFALFGQGLGKGIDLARREVRMDLDAFMQALAVSAQTTSAHQQLSVELNNGADRRFGQHRAPFARRGGFGNDPLFELRGVAGAVTQALRP